MPILLSGVTTIFENSWLVIEINCKLCIRKDSYNVLHKFNPLRVQFLIIVVGSNIFFVSHLEKTSPIQIFCPPYHLGSDSSAEVFKIFVYFLNISRMQFA